MREKGSYLQALLVLQCSVKVLEGGGGERGGELVLLGGGEWPHLTVQVSSEIGVCLPENDLRRGEMGWDGEIYTAGVSVWLVSSRKPIQS